MVVWLICVCVVLWWTVELFRMFSISHSFMLASGLTMTLNCMRRAQKLDYGRPKEFNFKGRLQKSHLVKSNKDVSDSDTEVSMFHLSSSCCHFAKWMYLLLLTSIIVHVVNPLVSDQDSDINDLTHSSEGLIFSRKFLKYFAGLDKCEDKKKIK